jgi:hypothetical protein
VEHPLTGAVYHGHHVAVPATAMTTTTTIISST